MCDEHMQGWRGTFVRWRVDYRSGHTLLGVTCIKCPIGWYTDLDGAFNCKKIRTGSTTIAHMRVPARSVRATATTAPWARAATA